MRRYVPFVLLSLLPHPYGLLAVAALLVPLIFRTWEHPKVRAHLQRWTRWAVSIYHAYRAGCWRADPRTTLGRAVIRVTMVECVLVGAAAVVYCLFVYPGSWIAWELGYRPAPTVFYTTMFGFGLLVVDFAFGHAERLSNLLQVF